MNVEDFKYMEDVPKILVSILHQRGTVGSSNGY